jgi:hypothetical protein
MSLSVVNEENNESDGTNKSLSLNSNINNSFEKSIHDLENLYNKLDFKIAKSNKKDKKNNQFDINKIDDNINRLFKNTDIIADFMMKILRQVRVLKSKVEYFETYFKDHQIPINYNTNSQHYNMKNNIVYISDDSLDSEDLKNCINNKNDTDKKPKLFEIDNSETFKDIFNPVNNKKVKYYYNFHLNIYQYPQMNILFFHLIPTSY